MEKLLLATFADEPVMSPVIRFARWRSAVTQELPAGRDCRRPLSDRLPGPLSQGTQDKRRGWRLPLGHGRNKAMPG